MINEVEMAAAHLMYENEVLKGRLEVMENEYSKQEEELVIVSKALLKLREDLEESKAKVNYYKESADSFKTVIANLEQSLVISQSEIDTLDEDVIDLSNELVQFEKDVLEIIKVIPETIQYISEENQTLAMALAAVLANEDNLQYIKDRALVIKVMELLDL